MPGGINLVVTCTKRKLMLAPAMLHLRQVLPGGPVEARARKWIERLRTATGEVVPVENLYAGDHWSISRSLATGPLFKDATIRIWVCSAGYGLIPFSGRIHPYSATFSIGHPDSVANDRTLAPTAANAEWWRLLAGWPGPETGSPRTLAELSATYPDDFLLIVVSKTYLQALVPDLRLAVEMRKGSDYRLAILCAGIRELGDLSPHLLPCDSRLQQLVGGALSSLNIRIARQLLEHVEPDQWSHLRMYSLLTQWIREQPQRARYDRTPMSDAEVRQAIREAVSREPAIRPTPLLRRLRDSGRACEHSRFVRLFHETAGGGNGSIR